MNVTAPSDWSIVALTTQLGAREPLKVPHALVDYVLFRDGSGICRALIDRCAHRRAPLSLGRITPEGLIECPYHGWRYDGATGACRSIPNLGATEKPPKAYGLAKFEVVEEDGFVWLGTNPETPFQNPFSTIPALGERQQGIETFVYPGTDFLDLFLDCPAAILRIDGVEILNDHRYGEPVIEGGDVTVEYAARPLRINGPPSSAQSDFPYLLRLLSRGGAVRADLFEGQHLRATSIFAAVPSGARMTRLIWQGTCGAADRKTRFAIRPRDVLNVTLVDQADTHVSDLWHRRLIIA